MKKLPERKKEIISAYISISPFFIIFLIFGLFPLFATVYMSFFKWDILGSHVFRGVENYTKLFVDPTFIKSLINTTLLWFLTTIPQIIICLILAVLLNNATLKGKNIFRLAIFVPNITSTVAVALIFSVVFGTKYGIINQLFSSLNINTIDWKGTYSGTIFAISSMINWRWIGQGVIIFLAALQGIPKGYYEAAEIDGASSFRKFISITIPILKPIIIFKLIISTIGGLNVFVEPLIFSGAGGGSSKQGLTMTLYMYEEAFTRNNFGYASSIACTMLIIVGLAVIVNLYVSNKMKGEE